MAPWGPKSGQNKLKIAVLPRKSAQRAYFVLEEVEKGWNTKEGIQPDNVRPIFKVKMVREKKSTNRLQKWQREAIQGPNIIQKAK